MDIANNSVLLPKRYELHDGTLMHDDGLRKMPAIVFFTPADDGTEFVVTVAMRYEDMYGMVQNMLTLIKELAPNVIPEPPKPSAFQFLVNPASLVPRPNIEGSNG